MKNIPFHKPSLNKGTIANLNCVVRSDWLTTGSQTKLFEEKIKNILGVKYGLAVSSCTAALHLSYLLMDLKKGAEVIVPSYTFCSTINTIIHTGATPVFCDILPDTLCIDPNDIKRKITKKTKAVVVVHFAGMAADIDKISAVCKPLAIKIIEDSAHAFHTKYKGKFIGSHGNIGCFSFYATKTLTTGEGGFLVLPSKRLESKARILALHGMSKNAWNRYKKGGNWRYDVVVPGYKYNMSDLHASVGLSQIPYVVSDQNERQKIALLYMKGLSEIKDIILPPLPSNTASTHSWHLFVIRTKKKKNRDLLMSFLKKKGIGVSMHFIANHKQSFYKNMFPDTKLAHTEEVSNSAISLPIYSTLKISDAKRIVATIRKYYDRSKA